MLRQDHIVVTGGAGFIGSNLVAELNRRGQTNITIVDNLGNSTKWRNLVGLDFTEYVDKEQFRELFRNNKLSVVPKVIYHLGACSSTTETDADYLMDNNYNYTRELCEYALHADSRFVYASSAATYGDGKMGYQDDETLLYKLRPLNMYGYSKHLFDLWSNRNGIDKSIVGLKYFNVYGYPEAHKNDMRSMIHKALCQIKESGKVNLFKSYSPDYGNGKSVRDFIYIKDVVDITLFFGSHEEYCGLFNCGTGKARSWNDVASIVFDNLSKDKIINYIDMPDNIKEQYQYYTEADTNKLHAAIGSTTQLTSLEDGIADYIKKLTRGNC
jgi:ADP-L-glycero-D-manno-heptose 6-epimerase